MEWCILQRYTKYWNVGFALKSANSKTDFVPCAYELLWIRTEIPFLISYAIKSFRFWYFAKQSSLPLVFFIQRWWWWRWDDQSDIAFNINTFHVSFLIIIKYSSGSAIWNKYNHATFQSIFYIQWICVYFCALQRIYSRWYSLSITTNIMQIRNL